MSLQNLWLGLVNFLPNFIFAILVFIIGWVIASVVGKAFTQVINALKLDKFFTSIGADEMFAKAGIRFTAGGFVGWLIKWLIIIAFLMASLEILNLTQVSDFLGKAVLGYLPQVIIAAFILILATVVSDVASRFVEAGARTAGVRSASMVGAVVKYAIWTFAFIIVLSQLGIAPEFMQILFTGIIATIAIAGGLAFGLGGRDAAARAIEKIRNDMSR